MQEYKIKPPRFSVRIAISIENCDIIDETVYWRYDLSMDMMLRYRWYFDYLAALVKVHNPHRNVHLSIINISNDENNKHASLCGDDYVRWALPRRLAAKRRELGKYTKDEPRDLFGFKEAENAEKAARIMKEIQDLENGHFNRWVPPVYINKIKKYCETKIHEL